MEGKGERNSVPMVNSLISSGMSHSHTRIVEFSAAHKETASI
jgi:hypothetical protein